MTHYHERLEAGEFAAPEKAPDDLDAMTKAQLHAEASRRGIDVSESWSKAEIREAIEAG